MNKVSIIVGLVVLLAVAGGVYFLMQRGGLGSAGGVVSLGGGDSSTITGKFADLLGAGKNLTCTFSTSSDGTTSSGTVYVAGNNKMRGDFTTLSGGQTNQTSMIRDGQWYYTWGPSMPNGIKMKLADVEGTQGQTGQAGAQQTANLDQQVDYKCSSWGVDESKFSPPSDIQFSDYSAMMQNLTASPAPGGASSNSAACSACDSLSDDTQKASCKKALGC